MTLNDGFAYQEQVGPDGRGQTVLTYLTRRWRHSDAATWAARLGRGEVEVNGRVVTATEVLTPGAALVWRRPPWPEEDVPLHFDVLHEDESVLAVAKPSGLPTMHGGGFLKHTLLRLVTDRFPGAAPLHRLGRATSGVVLFARTPHAASALSAAWRTRDVEKRYRALARGVPRTSPLEITAPIGPVAHPRLGSVFAASVDGKSARSVARALESRPAPQGGGDDVDDVGDDAVTLFEVDIESGRPHQIRIHLAWAGHPLVGDPLYGPGGVPRADLPGLPGDGGYLLHAERLVFTHPVTGERLTIHAPIPDLLRTRSC